MQIVGLATRSSPSNHPEFILPVPIWQIHVSRMIRGAWCNANTVYVKSIQQYRLYLVDGLRNLPDTSVLRLTLLYIWRSS